MRHSKKYKFPFLILTLMLISTASCLNVTKETNLPSYVNMKNAGISKGDTVLEKAMSQMGNPEQNWIKGDSMIFTDIDDEYIYTMVSISGDSIIDRLIARGEGPGQLLRPANFQIDSEGNIYIFDEIRKTLYSNSTLKEFLNGLDSAGTQKFKDATGRYLMKTAGGYVGDNLYGDGNIFTFFDNEGVAKTKFGLVPGTKISENVNPDFYMSYQTIFAISPDKKSMCAAGTYHDWLAFYDVSGDTPRLIKEYFTSPPIVKATGKDDRYHLERLPETIKHFFTIAPYNDGVFLNYIGASYENINNGEVSNHILQYSWDGELMEVLLPREKIYELCATQDGSQLYATFSCDSISEIKLIRYNIVR